MMTNIKHKIVVFILIVFSQLSYADWRLCNQASNLNFITSQSDQLTEVHSFSNMEGTISDQGDFLFKIDLSSIETSNSHRDLRIQDLLFETKKFQEATVSLNLGKGFFNLLEIDKAKQMPVQLTINLHGVTNKIETTLLVTRLKSNCIIVMSINPVIISLKDFDFLAGLEKLSQLYELDGLSKKVEVSFNLFFRSSPTL